MQSNVSEGFDNIGDKLEGWLQTIIEYLPNFGLAVIVLLVAYFVARYVNTLTFKLISKKVKQKSVAHMISRIAAILLVLIGLYIALGILNLSKTLTSLLATAGVAGLAIGLALQDTLSNTVAGVLLSFKKRIQLGNWVETNGFAGEVIDISLKEFVIKEADNNIVILPNKKILENPLKNYSITEKMRITISCGVGYESDLEKVEQLTKETLAKTFETIENAHDVEFYFTEFGDSSINYIARFWVNSKNMIGKLTAQNTAIKAIKTAYDNQGINIPFPIRTIEFNNKLSLDKNNKA